jgi:hypothetical protein
MTARAAPDGSLTDHSCRRLLWHVREKTATEWKRKDYAHHNKQRTMTLTCEEFLRRFLQHLLPKGFPRIRYIGR